MIVVSTSYAPPSHATAKCLYSVASQTLHAEHVYIDAALQDPPRSHFENLLNATAVAEDEEIVVCLDGDDWLLPGALARVKQEHDAGALVTYGSFVYADGRPGFAAPPKGPLRSAPWTTTHLKTFRAGLLRKIDPKHLRGPDGKWLEHARDLALMFPLLEMVGPRAHFIPDVLYVYNFANSTEHLGDAAMLRAEREAVAYVRGLPPYEAL